MAITADSLPRAPRVGTPNCGFRIADYSRSPNPQSAIPNLQLGGGIIRLRSVIRSGVILLILLLSVVLLAYANGANDNFKAVATLYGSSTLTFRASLVVATVAQVLGSVASVVLAGMLLHAFGGKGLVPDEVATDRIFLIAVGVGAAATVLIATRMGLPVSTTHALVGGLAGAGLALDSSEMIWSGLAPRFLTPLLVSPLLATVAAGGLYPLASRIRKRMGIDAASCLCVGRQVTPVSVTPDGMIVAGARGLRLTIAESEQCMTCYTGSFCGVTAQRLVDLLHLISGTALGFARGLNDTPKIMGLVIGAAWSGLNPRVALVVIAVVMALGGVLHSARIARTMGKRITTMNTGQGLLANVVASSLVIGASLAGFPVSTTHVSTGAIFGISLWTGQSNRMVVAGIVASWVITLPMAAVLAYTVAAAW